MRIAGIDPGKKGVVAILDAQTMQIVDYLLMPYDGKELDCAAVQSFLRQHSPSFAILERQIAMPKQGGSSIFTTGSGYGALRAILVCEGIPYLTPLPSVWTKDVLAGVPGSRKDKGRNIAGARRLFPALDMTPGRRTKPHDGIADAALLAYYGLTPLHKHLTRAGVQA